MEVDKLRNGNWVTIQTWLLKWFKKKREEAANLSSETIGKNGLSIFAEIKK